MVEVLNLYLDDSGTRHPDRNPGRKAAHAYDWFALGGFVIDERDKPEAERLHTEFCERWDIPPSAPLRSADIRAKTENFHWLKNLDDARQANFYEDLYGLLRSVPVMGLACVIDRPGYNARYFEKYGRNRWQLCKTAFSVVVERAAKRARLNGQRLRVHVERGDKDADRAVEGYYAELKAKGMPFDSARSGVYQPLGSTEFTETLYEFRKATKASRLTQLADLYLWPMAMGGYNEDNRPFRRLIEDGKLIDCHLTEEELPHLGIKYSCFELHHANKNKNPEQDSGSLPAAQGDLVG